MLREAILDLIVQEIPTDWSDEDIDDILGNDIPSFSEIRQRLTHRDINAATARIERGQA